MSCFSKIKTLAAVLTLTAAASAQFSLPQNARTAGMAGAPVSDISGVFNYPVLMMGYTDHLQATFSDGGIIGIKSVNDAFAIGLLANQGLMTEHNFGFGTPTSFATTAMNTLNSSIVVPGPVPTFDDRYNIPHLLLGFDLAALQLGADIFFEYARYSSSLETGASVTNASGLILNPGVRLSAAFDIEAVSVLAKFGVGFPSFNGETDAANVSVSSAKGLYMEMGAEAAASIASVDWTLGGAYTASDHKINAANYDSYWNSSLTFYLDAEFNVLETAVAAAEYSFTRNAATTVVSDNANVKNMEGQHIHSFAAGLENTWDNAWIFDSFSLRGGARYDITVDVAGSKNDNISPNTKSRSKQPGVHSAVSPVMGIGASKSFFTLDLCLDMGRWTGAFIGPPVALVSGTIKF